MKFISKKKHFIVLITALFLLIKASAQTEEPIKSPQREVVTLYSDILKEDRKIFIYTPKDSVNPAKAYPVVYVMDPENHFNMLVEYSKYLSGKNVMPPLIVVGIANTDRVRDLTPSQGNTDSYGKSDTTANSWAKTSGGNEQFLTFIEKELMPYVNLHYKSQPYRIFAGHSFGGIAAINCLINHPEMFDAYIATSPSLWWDQKYLLKFADRKLKSGSALSKTLFFSDGNEGSFPGSSFHTDALKFDSLLKKRNIKGLDFQYMHYPAESHSTVPVKSNYDGLRFIFRQWELPHHQIDDEKVNSGIIMAHYKNLSQKFGYQILPDEVYIDDWGQWLLKEQATRNSGINLLEMNTVNYPYSSRAFAALGAAYAIKGEKQKALASYKQASELNPSSTEIKLRLQELQK